MGDSGIDGGRIEGRKDEGHDATYLWRKREGGRREERPSEKNLSWKQLGYSEHASKGGREEGSAPAE